MFKIPHTGFCKHCHNKLEKYELSIDEFRELKQVFFDNVIIGKDVFLKSNPGELRVFQDFIQKMGQFDVVLDGLNVAYSSGAKPASILSAMVIFRFIFKKIGIDFSLLLIFHRLRQ